MIKDGALSLESALVLVCSWLSQFKGRRLGVCGFRKGYRNCRYLGESGDSDRQGRIEKETAEVVKLDYCSATPRFGKMRSADALGNYDRS